MFQFSEWLPGFMYKNFRGWHPWQQWAEEHNLKELSIDSIDLTTVGYWIAFFVVLLLLFGWLLRKHRLFEMLSKHVSWMAMTVWFFGVLIYIVGFYNPDVNGLSVVPRAIISSFKMFVVSHDLARVPAILQHDALYMALFSLVHFAAAFITFLFIFKMIGYKLKSSLDIFLYRIFSAKGKTVHLFWGVNEASCILAEDINKVYSSAKIIFIDIDEDCDDGAQKKVSLNRIVDTMTIKGSEMRRLDKIEALVDHCYNGPAAIKWKNENDVADIFAALHLNGVKAILRKSAKIKFYFLSDDEEQNVTGALNLQRDITLQRMQGEQRPEIYVHARRDANNEVLDHYSQYAGGSSRMPIKIIDSAYLSVAPLKEDDRTLPVNCIKFDEKTGVVENPFNALVVGFGATGQEAFKFLYEFAAFANSKRQRSPFKCYAVDCRMTAIEGMIRAKMPAIKEDKLELVDAEVDSEKFWTLARGIIDELNYVVIALNNDVLGLSLAVNLFKFALQYRSASRPMLKIMLRCYNHSQENRMDEVTSNLNKSIDGRNVEIRLFGRERELYTYQNILAEATLEKAKEFHYIYEGRRKESAEAQWNESFSNEQIPAIMAKRKISRYHAIYDINRCIAQNISNAQHCRTKMILLGFDEKEVSERMKLYLGYVGSRDDEHHSTKYHCDEADAQWLYNIAIVEHERWNASLELMGYTYNATRDYVKKHHECLLPWNELPDEATQSYDCKVVDTTIRLEYQRALKRSEKNNK